jgi:hypothetical protein
VPSSLRHVPARPNRPYHVRVSHADAASWRKTALAIIKQAGHIEYKALAQRTGVLPSVCYGRLSHTSLVDIVRINKGVVAWLGPLAGCEPSAMGEGAFHSPLNTLKQMPPDYLQVLEAAMERVEKVLESGMPPKSVAMRLLVGRRIWAYLRGFLMYYSLPDNKPTLLRDARGTLVYGNTDAATRCLQVSKVMRILRVNTTAAAVFTAPERARYAGKELADRLMAQQAQNTSLWAAIDMMR